MSVIGKRNDKEGGEEKGVPLGWMVTRLAWIAAKLVSSTATNKRCSTRVSDQLSNETPQTDGAQYSQRETK